VELTVQLRFYMGLGASDKRLQLNGVFRGFAVKPLHY